MSGETVQKINFEPQQTIMWLLLRHFKDYEAWGDPSKMDPFILFLIDGFRESLPKGCWIKVHCGYKEKGHTKNSFHYKGKAIDFHVIGMHVSEAESHLQKYLRTPKIINGVECKLIDFVGIGVYPEWADPGFHLDTRGVRASWARIKGKYVAYELGVEVIKNAA